ncbi:FxsA family protein [Streptodolium elevatio]|uniref:FxsA family protein n=1 Tax=Streptodolium elevatio TaxID=3157996 RepID=A0ABV3DWT8_9ACTN
MRRAAILLPLVALPILEIYLISRVGSAIGAGNTVLLLLAGVVAGSLAIKYAGRRALNRLAKAAAANAGPAETVSAVPTPETNKAAADAGLVVLGGILLIIPGFLSDALGILCLLPFTRPLLRRAIGGAVGSQLARRTKFGAAVGQARQVQDQMRMHAPDGRVVPGEVVEGTVVDQNGATVWRPGDNVGDQGPGRLPG